MKIFPLFCLASICCLTPVSGFAQTETETMPQPRVAAEAFVWRFAPPLGSRWQIRAFERTEITIVTPSNDGTPDAREVAMSSRNIVADYDVLSRDQFGATTARITLRELRFGDGRTENGKMVTFSDDRSQALQKNLQGASFTIKQAPTGEIWGVANTEMVTNRIATVIAPYDFEGAPSAQELQAKAQMMTKFLIGADRLRQILGLGGSPSYPVVTSESWPYAVALPDGFPFAFDLTGTRTLNRLTPGEAFIASNAAYDSATAPIAPVLKRKDGAFRSDVNSIKATMRGAARIERSSGLTLESTASWRLKSTILSRPDGAADASPLREPAATTIEVHTLLVPR